MKLQKPSVYIIKGEKASGKTQFINSFLTPNSIRVDFYGNYPNKFIKETNRDIINNLIYNNTDAVWICTSPQFLFKLLKSFDKKLLLCNKIFIEINEDYDIKFTRLFENFNLHILTSDFRNNYKN